MAKVNYSMSLVDLFDGFASDVRSHTMICALTLDSRTCIEGCVYFALKGEATHGLNFISDVLAAKATAVVVEANDDALTAELSMRISNSCELLVISALSEKLGAIAARFYATNSGECQIVAVTGTDGKTSVSHFVTQALNVREKCAGLLGTAGWGFPKALIESSLTTPDVFEVHRQIAEMRESGARYVCMEVSSHALEQGRVDGVQFTVAVLTNLARDHLDYHGTLENYAKAKRKLFLKPGLQAVILNGDDELGKTLLDDMEVIASKRSYGSASSCNFYLKSVDSGRLGLRINAQRDDRDYQFETALLGTFNAYNVLATWAILEELNISQDDIYEGLSALRPVVGRMEKFSNLQGPTLVVDFAHTPQALGLALMEVKKHCDGSVWCVFGCGGDRDKGKREKMGLAASTSADHVIVTNDNPRTEDPNVIAKDILSGVVNSSSVEVILDREKAIRHSLSEAASNDWIVIAGKGHENYQIFRNQRIEFSDREFVQQLLAEAV